MAVRIESQAEPIPGYRLMERLGSGGFGEVWKAEAPGGLMKAIKFVYGNLETVDAEGARAEQELKALNRVKSVRHPYILSLDRVDILDGQLIIVMELADRNIWDRFREARAHALPGIPRDELFGYMEEAAEALDFMNTQFDLQHLDIKPQNLFLIGTHLKVADFGLVKDLEGLAASVTGGVTPVYAAPETFDGWVSRFSDQYSLAIVIQELLTGKRPFAGANTRQLIMQHLQGQPDLEPLTPAERQVVARALSKNPAERHPSCLEFVRILRHADRKTRQISVESIRQELAEAEAEQHAAAGSDASTPVPVATPAVRTRPPAGVYEPDSRPDVPEVTARSEHRGEGVLCPALVIGLGQVGSGVLQSLRSELVDRYGDLAQLPHVRLLYIDTDADSVQAATHGDRPLNIDETQLVRLNRASRYLRPKDQLPPIAEWFDSHMLYRIPRNLVTAGIRALGRLAFVEHYRAIGARLRHDLERISTPESLEKATQYTGLALRSNWPRAYIVTSLAGGTGSGMLIDLAYAVKTLLREIGYPRAETIGVFFLPPVGKEAEQGFALANTYASLLELNHYSVSGQAFQARYEARVPPVQAGGPPLRRGVLLPLPNETSTSAWRTIFDVAGSYLFRDLMTALGRQAEIERQNGKQDKRTAYSSVGVRVYRSPRSDLIRRAAQRVCCTVTAQWLAKSTPELGGQIQADLQGQLEAQQLHPQGILERLQLACNERLEQPPHQLVAQWLEPIKKVAASGLPDGAILREFSQQVEGLLGAPDEIHASWRQPKVPSVLGEVSEPLAAEYWQQMSQITASYLDKAGYRMGGAEEAVKRTSACIEGWLKSLEQQAGQLGARLRESAERLGAAIAECEKPSGKLGSSQKTALAASLMEQLSRYPLLRYQQLLTQSLTRTYYSLRGRLSDQMRELGYVRQRLRELQRLHEEPVATRPTGTASEDSPNQQLLPGEMASLDDAVAQLVQSVSPNDLRQLDGQIQETVGELFPGLASVCLTAGTEVMRQLQSVMLQETSKFLEGRLPTDDVAALFLRDRSANNEEAAAEIQAAYEKAKPPLSSPSTSIQQEFSFLAVPESATRERFVHLAMQKIPDVKPLPNLVSDELVFYREAAGIALSGLEQLGPAAQEAYERSRGLEHFTPHTRLDIVDWQKPAP